MVISYSAFSVLSLFYLRSKRLRHMRGRDARSAPTKDAAQVVSQVATVAIQVFVPMNIRRSGYEAIRISVLD